MGRASFRPGVDEDTEEDEEELSENGWKQSPRSTAPSSAGNHSFSSFLPTVSHLISSQQLSLSLIVQLL